MGNCSSCFERLIRSLDKYDPANQPSSTPSENQPLLADKQPITHHQSHGKGLHSLSREEIASREAIIEEISEKIRETIAKNILLLGLLPDPTHDLQETPLSARSNMSAEGNNHEIRTNSDANNPDTPAPSASSSSSGIRLPREFSKLYELGKLVGIGTTSKVYQIKRRKRKPQSSSPLNFLSINGLLACKVINKKKLQSQMISSTNSQDIEPLLIQLRREVDILRRIAHPNIVSYYDFLETRNQIFIITEYLTGGELFDYLAANGPLPEEMTKYLIYDIFHAIAYLHEHSIIHRDIKAENCIFYTNPLTNEISLKLIDFGFSINLQASHMTSSFLGTVGYLAPEIVGNKYYNTSVDNWALGILLYVMIAARLPFKTQMNLHPPPTPTSSSSSSAPVGTSREENLKAMDLPAPQQTYHEKIASSTKAYQLIFPSKQWKNISEDCKDLIRELLQVDPMQRISSKNALLHPWFRGIKELKKLYRSKAKEKLLFPSRPSSSPTLQQHHQILTQTQSNGNNDSNLDLNSSNHSTASMSTLDLKSLKSLDAAHSKHKKLTFDSYHEVQSSRRNTKDPSSKTQRATSSSTPPAIVAEGVDNDWKVYEESTKSNKSGPSNRSELPSPHSADDHPPDEADGAEEEEDSNEDDRQEDGMEEVKAIDVDDNDLDKYLLLENQPHYHDFYSQQERLFQKSNRLRHTHSTLQLERKWNVSRRYHEDSSQHSLPSPPAIQAPQPPPPPPPSLSEPNTPAKQRPIVPTLSIPSPSSPSTLFSYIPHVDNYEEDDDEENTEGQERTVNERSQKDSQRSLRHSGDDGSFSKKPSFLWEEMHDRQAGDLFYSTYLPIRSHHLYHK